MLCPDLELFDRLALGQLSQDESSSLQNHLSACSSCAANFLEIQSNLGQFGRLQELLKTDASRRKSVQIPDRIGSYRVLREIGRGGMGVVYLAEQAKPRRNVAVKLMRADLISDDRVHRFERETELLGRLQHSGIAQVFEAGVSEVVVNGQPGAPQPYLAMEFVQGERLDHFVHQRNPSIDDRLELMVKICEAVHHAHIHGIIHRDLKPGNILIADPPNPPLTKGGLGGVGQPKILDFGLARILQAAGNGAPPMTVTELGGIAGTLPYMSPEQARGDPHAVDVRSDVYALGVVLYEMLLERLPYDIDRANLPQSIRAICEQPPRRPREHRPNLPRDVETILLKALDKEPTRRYASADALGGDIARFLTKQPILARPATLGYQLRKLIRRHQIAAAASAAALLLLVGAATFAMDRAVRATRGEAAALREAATADAVSQFLQDLIAAVEYGRHDVTLREALDVAARRIEEGALDDQPEVHVPVRNAIGNAYRALALYDQAEGHIRAALEIARHDLPADNDQRIDVPNDLALLFRDRGDFASAEPLLREALDTARQILPPDHPRIALALHNYGGVLIDLGELDRAEPFVSEALAFARRQETSDPEGLVACLNTLGKLQYRRGNLEAAESLLREALSHVRILFGDDHPLVASVLINLARVRRDENDLQEAETLFREAFEMRRRLHGDDHPNTQAVRNELAALLAAAGRQDEVDALPGPSEGNGE